VHLSDFASPAFFADPYPVYQRLRAEGPLPPLEPLPGVFVTGRHDTSEALLKDRKLGRAYRKGIELRYGAQRADMPVFNSYARMLLTNNPPKHTRLRALLMKAFNMRQLAAIHDLIQRVADRLIDRLRDPDHGRADLVRDFTLRLPAEVICHLLDVPLDDALQLTDATRSQSQALDLAPMSDAQLDSANRGTLDLEAYFRPLLAQRRRHPGDDLISLLLTVQEDGEHFTEDEIVANVLLLFIAGHETTSGMIGNALIALQRNPDQLALLKADPSLMPSAVMECLRYDSSVQRVAYGVLEDTVIEGRPLQRGQLVVIFVGSANRDPERFERADALDIRRPADSRPMSFGGGVHYCLGARLAAMEIEVALSSLLGRLPDLQIEQVDALRWLQRNTLRGVEALPVRWNAGSGERLS